MTLTVEGLQLSHRFKHSPRGMWKQSESVGTGSPSTDLSHSQAGLLGHGFQLSEQGHQHSSFA